MNALRRGIDRQPEQRRSMLYNYYRQEILGVRQ